MVDIWRIYLNNEAPLENNNNNITLMGDIWRFYLNMKHHWKTTIITSL